MRAIPFVHAASAEMVLEAINAEDGQKFMVEGDAQGIVKNQDVERRRIQLGYPHAISLAQRLSFCSFRFVFRNCNRAAHVIAKYALSLDHVMSWSRDFPTCV